MKIAFVGKICSGKSTCCEYLKNWDIRFEITNFAKMVKWIAYNMFFMKDKDRVLLQKIGTKMREIDKNVFVNCVIKDTKDSSFWLLDDARYPNEINALKDNGWHIVKLLISRDLQEKRLKHTYPDTYETHLARRDHESETSQDTIPLDFFDMVIDVDNEDVLDRIIELYSKLE